MAEHISNEGVLPYLLWNIADTVCNIREFTGQMKLRAFYKGKKLTARVRRDGSIRFAGKIFTSPSLAAGTAVKRRTCNGWTFWEYERAPGDWVKLDKLRK